MLLHPRKTFYCILLVLISLVLYQAYKAYRFTMSIDYKSIDEPTALGKGLQNAGVGKSDMKYILQWTSPNNVPLVYMGKGQQGFLERKCPYTNCFVTADRSLLGDTSKFDAIVFAGPEVVRIHTLPEKRSSHQKFVFATIESASNYPACSNRFDGYFNWTWTYNLDSEVQWGYFAIRDSEGVKVGPKKQMHWMKAEDMDPVSEEFRNGLKTKTKAAAWFVSNCYTLSHREDLVKKLKEEMKNYDMELDVYGKCGNRKCPTKEGEDCDKLLKDTYYYYLAFENSFSEDYVTEKLLHALENNVVPVVFGGANYSRFMPDGIYLNAKELDLKKLVSKMDEGIKDANKYAEYFRWKNHYSYHRQFESFETDPYCLFCTHLNNEEMVRKTTIYKDFRKWWDTPGRC